MNPKQILEGNKLIAEFHGWKHIKTSKTGKGHWDFIEKGFAQWDLAFMKYHLSYDWLSPVVENIENFKHIDDEMDDKIFSVTSCINIKDLWVAVVEFITWYNKQKK